MSYLLTYLYNDMTQKLAAQTDKILCRPSSWSGISS